MTEVSIPIPDDVIQHLKEQWPDIPQKVLETFAIEAYRMGMLTAAEVQRMLRLSSRWETNALLKEARAYLDYTEANLEQDLHTLETLGKLE